MASRRVLLLVALVFALLSGPTHASFLSKKKEHPSHTQDYYWYNTKTGATQWENPIPIHKDEKTGLDYYVDPVTGESAWEKPAKFAWKEAQSNEHNTAFYYNEVTKESSWDKPEMLSWTKVKIENPGDL